MEPTQDPNQPKTETDSYVVVNFLDLDTSKITFMTPKANKYKSKSVGIRYDGRILYVRYGGGTRKFTCPFGINVSCDMKENTEYEGNKKVTGYSLALSLPKDYLQDPYFLKARELDAFFVNACLENAFIWGLGGTDTEAPDRKSIEGYDKWGYKGKWKRLLKPSYKDDKATNKRTYQDEYAPRLEFGLKSTLTESFNDAGKKVVAGEFNTNFYDKNNNKILHCRSDRLNEILPKMSSATVVAVWQSIALGEFGASMKPKAEQIKVFPSERLTNECLLGGDEGDEDDGPGLLSENMMDDVQAVPTAKNPPPLKPVMRQQVVPQQVQQGDPEDPDEQEDGEDMQYVNTPQPVVTKPARRIMPSKKS